MARVAVFGTWHLGSVAADGGEMIGREDLHPACPDIILADHTLHPAEMIRMRVREDDRDNRLTLVVWTNLTVSLDERPTANTLMLQVLDQIYEVSPLRQD